MNLGFYETNFTGEIEIVTLSDEQIEELKASRQEKINFLKSIGFEDLYFRKLTRDQISISVVNGKIVLRKK